MKEPRGDLKHNYVLQIRLMKRTHSDKNDTDYYSIQQEEQIRLPVSLDVREVLNKLEKVAFAISSKQG